MTAGPAQSAPLAPALAPLPVRSLIAFDARAMLDDLTARGALAAADVQLALGVARQNGMSPLKAVLDLGLIAEDALADALALWASCPRWRPADEQAAPSTALPREFMRSSAILALADGVGGETAADAAGADGPLRVIIADPSDHHALQSALARLAGRDLRLEAGSAKDIAAFLDERGDHPDAESAADRPLDLTAELAALRDMASEAPVIRLFNQIVERALDLSASDIHLERFDRRTSLRYRVDGVLIEHPAPPPAMYDPLMVRLKIMGALDIAERRRAQDGRIRMRLRGGQVDLRISIIPTMYGQDAAIRVQERARLASVDLADLGFTAAHEQALFDTANRSHGILLITGPTGSGKTTTLYAMLRRLASRERKCITVEDPIEFAMDGINQIQANAAIGLTFSTTLRHILRHDPDVILIGEIRDAETAEMAFQSALTGHMVLSTLHTNDVPSTFVRLIDMGVEPYLVNAAVEGVSAQRLLRRLCATCANTDPARETCRACNGLGYKGRVAAMEFSTLPSRVKQLMLKGAEEAELRRAFMTSGYRPMRDDATRLIAEGITDHAEVARVLGAHAPDDAAVFER